MSWERTGLIVGVLLALVTLVSRLKWIGRQFTRLSAWVGRRAIWSLIHSDSDESRAALLKLLDAERQDSLERITANTDLWRRTRTELGRLEDAVVELEQRVATMRKEMAEERREMRFDMQAMKARMENEGRDIRAAIERTRDEMSQGMRKLAESVHTVLGIVGGVSVLRETHTQQHDATED